jgi:uncharacterized protein YfaQ (DUF2300 family)
MEKDSIELKLDIIAETLSAATQALSDLRSAMTVKRNTEEIRNHLLLSLAYLPTSGYSHAELVDAILQAIGYIESPPENRIGWYDREKAVKNNNSGVM